MSGLHGDVKVNVNKTSDVTYQANYTAYMQGKSPEKRKNDCIFHKLASAVILWLLLSSSGIVLRLGFGGIQNYVLHNRNFANYSCNIFEHTFWERTKSIFSEFCKVILCSIYVNDKQAILNKLTYI